MTTPEANGVIHHNADRPTDYLYRLSLKCFIQNERGEVLVVKERGRTWWDIPGGGMDHGEDFKEAIAREMHEEVSMSGDFTCHILEIDNPGLLPAQNIWQVRLIFAVHPQVMLFARGDDGDEVTFMDPRAFQNSNNSVERRIYQYSQLRSMTATQ